MSEYLRHDYVEFVGSLGATGTIVPSISQLNKDGGQYIDCRFFNGVSVHLTGTWAAAVQVQFSSDGVNWVTPQTPGNLGGVAQSYNATGQILNIPVLAKYLRIQCTSYTSGTINVRVMLTSAANTYPNTTQMTIAAGASLGAGTYNHRISTADTNPVSVKGSQGTINALILSNNGAGVAYFKLYDKASAPTVGTDTPVATILIPINGTVAVPCGGVGMRCPTGIAYAITGGMAVADTTAVGAAQVSVAVNYT